MSETSEASETPQTPKAAHDLPNAQRRVEVSAADLPLHCPMPGKRLWDSHPRVYLPMESGEQRCPYCGTLYLLVDSAETPS